MGEKVIQSSDHRFAPSPPSPFNPQSSFLAQGRVAQRAQFIVGVLPLTIEVRGNDPG